MSAARSSTVIVVFGAAVWPGGEPSRAMRRRVEAALHAYREHPGARILVTGGVGRHPPSEAEVMRRLLLEAGVPQHEILVEERSATTLASVLNCLSLLRELDGDLRHDLITCTDRYHQLRSILLFRMLGTAARGWPVASGRDSAGPLRWAWYHLRELAALGWNSLLLGLHRCCGLRIRSVGD